MMPDCHGCRLWLIVMVSLIVYQNLKRLSVSAYLNRFALFSTQKHVQKQISKNTVVIHLDGLSVHVVSAWCSLSCWQALVGHVSESLLAVNNVNESLLVVFTVNAFKMI